MVYETAPACGVPRPRAGQQTVQRPSSAACGSCIATIPVSTCHAVLTGMRHTGMGFIGEDGFRRILRHKTFAPLPLVCETPLDDRRDDKGNIEKVRVQAG
ncbi:MAG: hypothetical protein EHM53_14050 [Methanoregulaceae archaeon]|nr:MAG: hypothetical protein EHM53_14050 [Methanoregulaceae archaeon]